MRDISKIFVDLSIEEIDFFKKDIKEISFKPGEPINDLNTLPEGIIFILEGKLRLIAYDQKKEPFSLETYEKGEIAGSQQLIRGCMDQILTASTKAKCQVLPAKLFLELLSSKNIDNKIISKVSASELFDIAKKSKISNNLSDDELFSWAKLVCSNKKLKVLNLFENDINPSNLKKNYLVSSSNIKNHAPGSVIENLDGLEIIGKLPARLIEMPTIWPPTINQSKSKDKDQNLDDHNEKNKKVEYLQKEALEDWYGRIRDDGSYPHLKGKGALEEPFSCLRMLARHFDLPFRKDVIQRILNNQLQTGNESIIKLQTLAAILDILGLRASGLQPNSEELLSRAPFPAILMLKNTPIIIWESSKDKVLISDPREEQKWVETKFLFEVSKAEELSLLCIEKNANAPKARFGLSWFIPSIKKHKGALAQVVITSFFVQLLGLFNPLLIQQIIDAVISQGNYSSLNVLGTLLIAMALAQALLGSLRTYLFSDTTNRIDISLGASIINHLLRLPLSYFAKRPVGEVSSRIGELEKIRSFLTGTALTVLLDAIFSFIYIGVMLLYSVPLTIAALGVVPLFIALTVAVSPIIRRQLREGAEANARVQSHLVETLAGMETVKGQGMELPSEWRWEQLYGGQIEAGFRNTITSTAAGSANQFLGQVSGLIIIWYGAILVLDGKLTLGQLIAFRILSGYVTSPLLRLASLWQNFQETALSLERLSDVVDHPEEIEITGENLPPIPPIKGSINYDSVSFRFSNSGPMQLLNVNLSIDKGSFIGIVGSSGSGKSTLLKLLTKLYEPENGTIRIDNYDISKVDLYSLRSQIGVVPQDSLLFDGSVQANIGLTRPDANFEDIQKAAKIACADDFIETLPSGYSSSVGERGSALSGGQRQRIAIARMVLKRPKLLILDEATSALDVDTEQRLTRNLAEEYKESTVLFITHRLGSLKHADKIFVMHEGSLVEEGNHETLIALSGRYATLYKQQENL
tara:strand:+ start:489 stop:3425 length:2937 start_codon:yes stop_codon:yes gene_type:complete